MYLYYFTPRDLQVARVDRQCIVRFCEAFGKYFDKLFLISVKIKLAEEEIKSDDLYQLYGVKRTFEFVQLPVNIYQKNPKKFDALKILWAYSVFAFRNIRKCKEETYIYLKNYAYSIPFLFLKFFNKKIKIIFEIHNPPKKYYQAYLMKKFDKIIANSNVLAKELMETYQGISYKILGTHQGINLNYVNSIRIPKYEARARLNLPKDKIIVLYTGKVYYGYKEIDYYISTAKLLSDKYLVLIVGGRKDHVDRIRNENENAGNLRFISFVPPNEIYYYHFAADILLIYYPSGFILNNYRSPGKIFDYMASGNPIIAADYPVLEEILESNKEALFVEKDNPAKLASKIDELARDTERRKILAQNAMEKVQRFTWEKRAEGIIQFINHKR
ncbi:MAG: glycosyltransferase family 4 protein [Ignavibacteriaceae bacterium]|nr:glycosyltransferase family 4 protein [Ignavibacteriaceae bacterium]